MAAQPISAQLADRLAKMILDGEYRPGEQLPTERELARAARRKPHDGA